MTSSFMTPAPLCADLHLSVIGLGPYIKHTACPDPHYGWHDECFCELHRHLLVGGRTRLPKP
ncbi:hypothetical protein BZL54_17320 [Burkholderia ubonensis subsp. mesacidophila]|uniref:Uncharacterized protein n=1 Tax=Burkholderia ubonensis subsp. mesacidophila TaxID=265293 RepID=A0A2A4FEE2_9BURK|nr:hypothetical protein BZL54_17320 [Burkholderia ubonensis subsp. mesacidophila]